jgi:hypothetical protein
MTPDQFQLKWENQMNALGIHFDSKLECSYQIAHNQGSIACNQFNQEILFPQGNESLANCQLFFCSLL